jgi:hypothetical protein
VTKPEDCTLGATHTAEIVALQKSDTEQWADIDRIKNRLPVWATFIISILMTLCGVLVTMAAVSPKGGV